MYDCFDIFFLVIGLLVSKLRLEQLQYWRILAQHIGHLTVVNISLAHKSVYISFQSADESLLLLLIQALQPGHVMVANSYLGEESNC
jgi:hypothetical protein